MKVEDATGEMRFQRLIFSSKSLYFQIFGYEPLFYVTIDQLNHLDEKNMMICSDNR